VSALAEALLAAQRQAVAALSRSWLAAPESDDEYADLLTDLDAIGCTDKIDQAHYIASLRVLKTLGVNAPATNGATVPKEDRPASDAQWKLLRRLADERSAPAPDGPLTVEQASKVIEELKAGTYNADAWSIPF
jgi:hypothetical protein